MEYTYVDNLYALTKWRMKSGLTDVKKYFAEQGNIHKKLEVFHVAGTNGKWSVCQMISQVLYKQCGKKVWLFTSPHLEHITERIQINGEPISSWRMDALLGDLFEQTKDTYNFSFFEMLTICAVIYFIKEEVEYAVFEVGVWWTLDSTNIWESPVATFITSISLDHSKLLWWSLASIQKNKMGIMKPGVPCYTTVDNPLMHKGAKESWAKLVLCAHEEGVPTSLVGNHQRSNALLVYKALLDAWFVEQKIRQWLMDVVHPGRCEYVRKNIILDGAHNLAGLQALQDYIDQERFKWRKIITIFGCCKKRKEFALFAHELIQWDLHICVQPSHHRWLDPYEYHEMMFLDNVVIQKNPKRALEEVCATLEDDTLLLIYGSLYLIGEVRWFLKHI